MDTILHPKSQDQNPQQMDDEILFDLDLVDGFDLNLNNAATDCNYGENTTSLGFHGMRSTSSGEPADDDYPFLDLEALIQDEIFSGSPDDSNFCLEENPVTEVEVVATDGCDLPQMTKILITDVKTCLDTHDYTSKIPEVEDMNVDFHKGHVRNPSSGCEGSSSFTASSPEGSIKEDIDPKTDDDEQNDEDDDDDDDYVEDDLIHQIRSRRGFTTGSNGQRRRTITDRNLTEEEKKLLAKEGYVNFPGTGVSLTKQEEKVLRKVRRKIRNKKSAQCSRQRKKEYVEQLEKKYEKCSSENTGLKRELMKLKKENSSLLFKMKSLLNNNGNNGISGSGGQASLKTMFFVMILSCMMVIFPYFSPDSVEDNVMYGLMSPKSIQGSSEFTPGRHLLMDSNFSEEITIPLMSCGSSGDGSSHHHPHHLQECSSEHLKGHVTISNGDSSHPTILKTATLVNRNTNLSSPLVSY